MADAIAYINSALEGRYQIERQLGEGGMAKVYLAHDLKHGRMVALKVMKPELAAVVGAERFLAEIKTTATLQHPNILPLFDSGIAGSYLFFVMPYVEGESLQQKLDRERQLPVSDAVSIAASIAEALEYAHSQGVVHRDIKPANILLVQGKPVITDFGIALAVSAGGASRLTETGLSLGTPQYMSPEQATGDQNIGPVTDVYALGCVLYEMLVGQPPFTGDTMQAVMGKVISGQHEAAGVRRRSTPTNVDDAIEKALEQVPADRFSSALAFSLALNDPAFRHRSAEPSSRVNLAGLVLAALLLVVVLQVIILGRRPASESGESRFLEIVLEPPIIPNENGESVHLSPDGSSIAYRGADGGWWVSRFSDRTLVRLDEFGSGQHLSFGPTAQEVAMRTGSRAGRIEIGNLLGGPARTIAEGIVSGFAGIDWGEDGWIYFTDIERRLARVRVSDGTVESLTALDSDGGEVAHVDPYALQDGSAVVFVIRKGRQDNLDHSELAVLDIRTMQYRSLHVNGLSPKLTSTGYLVFARPDGTLMAGHFDRGRLAFGEDPIEVLNGVNIRGGNNALADFEISRNGDLLYLEDAPFGSSHPVWVAPTGGEEIAGEGREGIWGDFDLSRDGRRFVVAIHPQRGPRNLYAATLPDGPLTRLTFGDAYDSNPVFFSDSIVLFTSPRARNWDLYARRWDGTGNSWLVLDRSGEITLTSTSEEAGVVVFTETETSGTPDLYVLWLNREALTADSITALATTSFTETAPAIAPGGTWVAYTSDESGQTEVWVTRLSGGSDRFQISYKGGTAPTWNQTGTELYYLSPVGFLTVVSVTLGNDFDRGAERTLFPTHGADLVRAGPDGRFLMIRSDGERIVHHAILATDWLVDLQRRFAR